MDFNYNKGRPFGRQTWFINKKFKIYETKFINRHISFVHLNVDKYELVFIGVHLPFESTTDKVAFKLNFTNLYR